jgi:hypothetical protein
MRRIHASSRRNLDWKSIDWNKVDRKVKEGSPRQRLAFEGLEPYDGKLSRWVLRGLGAGNSPRLPGLVS